MMDRAVLFLLFAVLLRAAAAALRADPPRRSLRVTGWAAAMLASWVAASGAGAWTPLGPALLAALLGAPVEWNRRRTVFRFAGEGALFFLAAPLALPPAPSLRFALYAVLWTGFGFALDLALRKRAAWIRTGAVLLPAAAAAAIWLIHPWAIAGARRALDAAAGPSRLLFLAFGPAARAERIDLPGGGVAWYEPSPEGTPAPGALLLHGAEKRGSAQAAAQVMRRALRDAGFAVLALDHPGYGASPAPDTARAEAWDPLPDEKAALDTLIMRGGGAPVVAVGHSMGAREAVRMLGARPDLAGAVLFGANLEKRGPVDDYWYGRFHEDRRFDFRLPRERVDRILDLHYRTIPLIRRLPAGRKPILFVRFEREHENIRETRDLFFARLPKPKTAYDLKGSNHYFNAGARIGLLAGDARAARRTAAVLTAFRRRLAGATDAPLPR